MSTVFGVAHMLSVSIVGGVSMIHTAVLPTDASSSVASSAAAPSSKLTKRKRRRRRKLNGQRRRHCQGCGGCGGYEGCRGTEDRFSVTDVSLTSALATCFPKDSPSYNSPSAVRRGCSVIDDPSGGQVDIHYNPADIDYGVAQCRVFDDVWPSQLPSDRGYTFVITACGHVTYGYCQDRWQVGVKHMALARGRWVVSAGELVVSADGKSCRFNLDSGQYIQKMLSHGLIDQKQLETVTQRFFAMDRTLSDVVVMHGHNTLLPTTPPAAHELRQLLRAQFFCQQNPHLVPVMQALLRQVPS